VVFLTLKLLPRLVQNVVHESLSSHRVLASVASRATEKHNLRFANNGDSVTETSLRSVSMDFESVDNSASAVVSTCSAFVALAWGGRSG